MIRAIVFGVLMSFSLVAKAQGVLIEVVYGEALTEALNAKEQTL